MDYYRDQVTQESWDFLTQLVKTYRFVLIGGWAIWLYTHQLKSKDIDIIVGFDQLDKLKSEFDFVKNERLRKYEARRGSVAIDIYVPQYSDLGIPLEEIQKQATALSGFRVPKPSVLLILKQVAYQARKGSTKGQKDLTDIFSLLSLPTFDWKAYRDLLAQVPPGSAAQLSRIITSTVEVPELGINRHQYAKRKKVWLRGIGLWRSV